MVQYTAMDGKMNRLSWYEESRFFFRPIIRTNSWSWKETPAHRLH